MATISNTPRPGYVWDSTDNCWYPIGTGPHTHSDYITQSTAINPSIVDAKGDIIAASAADTVARLAVGANDTVLTADSSTATGLKWATPSAGGMTLISTTSLSGTTTTLSSIPQTYNSLFLVIQGVTTSAGNNEAFECLPNNQTALCDQSYVNSNGASTNVGYGIYLSAGASTERTSLNSIWSVQIDNYTSTTSYKSFAFAGGYQTGASTRSPIMAGGYFRSNTAITSLVFKYASSTMNGGTVLLYGVK
jgi:hypothetical protein